MKKRNIAACLLAAALVVPFAACGGEGDGEGNNGLKLTQGGSAWILENNRIKISFDMRSGAIREVYNKTQDMSLVKDVSNGDAVSIQTIAGSETSYLAPQSGSFTCSVAKDAKNEKALSFGWSFSNGVKVTASASLKADADEVVFAAGMSNLDGKTLSVQYPVIDKLGALTDDGENDYLVSSLATGYLFRNPAKNFARFNQDITGEKAFYPMGFGATMQFMGYYTQDKGGFYLHTRDGGNTVKDFIVKADGGNTLQMEIGHYVSDLARKTVDFRYETVISNLYEGNWYEPAEKYKEWAVAQSWATANGLNAERTDLNKDLYENSVLCNFILPSKADQVNALDIYEKTRKNIKAEGSKIFTVPYYYAIPQEVNPSDNIEAYFNALKNEELFDALEENGEPIAFFEYTDLEKENILPVLPDYIQNSAMRNAYGGIYDIRFDGLWKFICAGNDRWVKIVTDRQKEQFTKLGAQGIYNDVGICSTHPVFCYDSSHTHGTRINSLPEFYNLLETSWKISRSVKVNEAGDNGFTGQEMITEQVIPWVDFYQTRAGAGEMGCMENSAIMNLVKGDVAYKIPLFEFVYHEYAGVRGDGFVIPVDSVGVPYYATVASVALNGGIPEFNYECYNNHIYTGLENLLDENMIGFIDKLGEARLSYGKNYLVYGAMARVPSLNLERERYAYETPLVNNWTEVGGSKKGSMYVDPVASSAFTFGGKTAIFLCNITESKKPVRFTLDAGSLYGIESGSVTFLKGGAAIGSAQTLRAGKTEISLELDSREVYMLVVE